MTKSIEEVEESLRGEIKKMKRLIWWVLGISLLGVCLSVMCVFNIAEVEDSLNGRFGIGDNVKDTERLVRDIHQDRGLSKPFELPDLNLNF